MDVKDMDGCLTKNVNSTDTMLTCKHHYAMPFTNINIDFDYFYLIFLSLLLFSFNIVCAVENDIEIVYKI